MANPKTERRLFYLLIAYAFVCFNLLRHFTSDPSSSSEETLLKVYRSKSDLSNHFISTYRGDVNLKVINDKVYSKLGFQIVEMTSPIATLRFIKQPACGSNLNFSQIPMNLQLSMFNFSSVSTLKRNELSVVDLLDKNDNNIEHCDSKTLLADSNQKGIAMKNAMKFHFQSLNEHDGLIIGRRSEKVMECLALETGAKQVLKLPTAKSSLNLINNYQFVVLSSFPDPIHDLQEVHNIRCVLKTEGLLFLPIRIGLDHVLVDSHRVYGAVRLPMLITGFQLIGVFTDNGEVELNEKILEDHVKNSPTHVLVLKKFMKDI